MITLERDNFLNAIKSIKNCTARNAIQPVLNCVHFKSENGSIVLTSTDLTISGRAFCEANIEQDLDICLNANKIEEIVGKMDKFIKLEQEDAFLKISSGNTVFKILIVNSVDFPNINFSTENATCINIDAESFLNGINKALVATSNNENQILNSICLTLYQGGYELASTDGNRLCQIKCKDDINEEKQYIIPQRILQSLAKNAKDYVEIYTFTNNIVFKTNNCIFKQNLLAGVYPKYQQLIPTSMQKKAVVKRSELLSSLEKVAIMCDDRHSISTFCFDEKSLIVKTSCEYGSAKDIIEISCNEGITIAFNYKYILEGIRVMETEDIEFQMNTDLSACLIKGDFIYLVMPVNREGIRNV